jgi:hypothetical protein
MSQNVAKIPTGSCTTGMDPDGPPSGDRLNALPAGRKTGDLKPKRGRRRCDGCDRLAMLGEYYCYQCASAR